MPWTDFHIHCNYCSGTQAPETFILAAIEKGLPAIGFNCHSPLPFVTNWSMEPIKSVAYIKEIKRLKLKYAEQIDIYAGMESSYVPGLSGPDHKSVKKLGLDFVSGTIRFVDQFEDGTPWQIDKNEALFERGINEIFEGNIQKAVERYFELMRWMIMLESPDIITHFNLIEHFNQHNKYFKNSAGWYRFEVEKTLRAVANSYAVMDICTRGLYTGERLDLQPGKWMLSKILEAGIPITIGSDAHESHEISGGFKEASTILKGLGFKRLSILYDGHWQDVSFSETGIEILYKKAIPSKGRMA